MSKKIYITESTKNVFKVYKTEPSNVYKIYRSEPTKILQFFDKDSRTASDRARAEIARTISEQLKDQVEQLHTELQPISDELEFILSIQDDILKFLEIYDQLEEILIIEQHLNELLDIYQNLSSITDVYNNLTIINNINDNLIILTDIFNNLSKLNIIYDNLSELNIVHDNITNIQTISNNILELQELFNNLNILNSLYNSLSILNNINDNINILTDVHEDLNIIESVFNDLSNINSVADKLTEIESVYNNLNNVNIVANNISSVNTVSDNMSPLLDIYNNLSAILESIDYSIDSANHAQAVSPFTDKDNVEFEKGSKGWSLDSKQYSIDANEDAIIASDKAGEANEFRDQAETFKNLAERWASEDRNVIVQNGEFSAKHYYLETVDTVEPFQEHLIDFDNPHQVNKEQVGLSNVDNVQQIPLSEKGQANGVAPLNNQSYVPISNINPAVRSSRVVNTIDDRNSIDIEDRYEGYRVHVIDATDDETVNTGSAGYILKDGLTNNDWVKTYEAESLDIDSTDDIDEGQNNLYFTEQRAKDAVDKIDVGLGDVPNLDTTYAVNSAHDQNTDTILDQGGLDEVSANAIRTHIDSSSNPHSVTQVQVGLGNVLNVPQYSQTEIDNFFDGSTSIIGYNKSDWDTAFGWGDHSTVGYAFQTNLDNHTGDSTIHFTQAQISITESQISDLTHYTDGDVYTFLSNNLIGGTAVTIDFNSIDEIIIINSSDTTYTAGEGISLEGSEFSLSDERFTTDLLNKLDGIEEGAQVNEVNEAPTDGEQYVRQNSAWVVVDIPEGYDSSDFDTDFNNKSTDDLSEGINNLYFTDGRSINAIQNDPSWNATDWDTAYGWGDHSTVGYITDYTVTNSDLTGLNISELNNDTGYITDYTVTQTDVTQHEGALTITESQISDLSHYTDSNVSNYLQTALLDGDNISIVYDINDDTFTFNVSGTLANYYVDGLSFDDTTGTLTASVSGTDDQSVGLDGRYSLLGHSHTESDITDLDKYTQSEVDNLLDAKVDKVAGKGLSEEDFTTSLLNKLNDIEEGAEVNEINEAPTDGEQYVRQNSSWAVVNIPEGYDSTDFDTDFNSKSTDDLSEGTVNLYFTDSRAVTAIQNDVSWNATNWDTAFGWGDHSTEGYLTSIPITYVQENDNISRLTNDVGYITGYTVTEGDVTQHQTALTITESQISDLSHYVDDDVITVLNNSLVEGDNITITYDVALDTFTFSVSGSLDNFYLDGLTFDDTTGEITASVSGATNQTVNIDGRYSLLGHGHTESDISDLDKYTQLQVNNLLDNKVDKIAGKGLSTEDFTTTLYTKLVGIEAGAEVNEVYEAPSDGEQYVRQDGAWALVNIPEGYDSGDFDTDFATKTTDDLSEGTTNLYFTDSRAVTAIQNDVSWNAGDWDTAFGWGDHSVVGYALETNLNTHISDTTNPHSVTKSQVGLGNVDDVQQIPLSEKGANDGVAPLNIDGIIPSIYLDPKFRSSKVVANLTERDAIDSGERFEGLRVHVIDATADATVNSGSAGYILKEPLGNTDWVKTYEAESLDIDSTDDIDEGSTNLYFTDGRAVSAIQNDPSWNAGNWDSAFGWGDHSLEGYLTSIPTTYVQENDDITRLTNNAGYITGYTVTQSDVTQHQGALTITESQISDLVHYTNNDALTLLETALVGGNGISITHDGVADTFTFDVVGDLNNFYLNDLIFDDASGDLTAFISGTTNQTVNLDGRYSLLGHTHTESDITDLQNYALDSDVVKLTSEQFISGLKTFTNKLTIESTQHENESLFEIIGVNGSLFSINDSSTGSFFSVTNTEGLPLFEVFDPHKIIMGEFGENSLVVDGSQVGIGEEFPEEKLHVNNGNIFIENGYLIMESTTKKWSISITDDGNLVTEEIIN